MRLTMDQVSLAQATSLFRFMDSEENFRDPEVSHEQWATRSRSSSDLPFVRILKIEQEAIQPLHFRISMEILVYTPDERKANPRFQKVIRLLGLVAD